MGKQITVQTHYKNNKRIIIYNVYTSTNGLRYEDTCKTYKRRKHARKFAKR